MTNTKNIKQNAAIDHIKDLRHDPRNARKHTPRNVGAIVSALHEVGAARSIVIDEDGVVLAGNATIDAAAEAGITKVQVIDADGETVVAVRRTGLTPKQKTRLALFDNRAAELAEWDADVLRGLADEGTLGGMFTDDELAELLQASDPADGLTDPDAVPDERATDIVAGDMFALGKHLLLCGDSTKADDVARLGSEQAELLFTSPPYADARDYGGCELDPVRLSGFLATFHAELYCVNLGLIRRDGALLPYWDEYIKTAQSSGLRLLSWNVWDRGIAKSVAQKTAMFQIEHEWILVFGAERKRIRPTVPNPGAGEIRKPTNRQADGTVRKAAAKIVRDLREIGTVYRGGTVSASDKHPAMFPVEFPATYIAACSSEGGIVAEPFSGSGTTLIACEQLGRACHAIEIEPRYVQVAIDRWEQFTGQKAVKVGADHASQS